MVAQGLLASVQWREYLKKTGVKLRATQLLVGLMWLPPVCVDTGAGGEVALTEVVGHD